LRGFASIRLPNRLVIHDVVICQAGDGHAWANLPAKPMIDDTGVALRDAAGKVRYRPVLEWPRELLDEFGKRVIALVREAHPEALDPAGTRSAPRRPSNSWSSWPLGRPGMSRS
jgi:hypothetical protein